MTTHGTVTLNDIAQSITDLGTLIGDQIGELRARQTETNQRLTNLETAQSETNQRLTKLETAQTETSQRLYALEATSGITNQCLRDLESEPQAVRNDIKELCDLTAAI